MSEAASGSTLLTEGVGTPQGGAPAAEAAPAVNGSAAPAAKADPSDWRSILPEDLRNEPVFQKYQKPEDAFRSHVNLEKLLGGEKIPKPRSDDDAEGWDRWFKAAGRPDKPEEYAFERPNSLPDNFYDEAAEKSFKNWAHSNGLTKRQAANLHDTYVKNRLEQHHAWQTSQKQASEEAQSNLRREWGGQYDAKISAAKAALSAFADPDYLKEMDESGKGNDPRVIRAWAKIGEKMVGERSLKGAPQIEGGDPKTAIRDFEAKYKDALHSKSHPDHDARLNQLAALYQQAFPG